jgi:predicted phosphate transport protein (TIGR00153 family)
MMIFKKEKEVRELVLEHLSLSQDCLSASRSVLEHYLLGEKEAVLENSREVKRLEREADRCKRQARVVLHAGAFLPQLRSDIHQLVEMVDEINAAAEMSTKCLVNESPEIPQAYGAALMEIYEQNVACFHELHKAMKCFFKPKGEIGEMHQHVALVCQLESEVDLKQANLTRQVFDSGLELAKKTHFCQLLRYICNISDYAEDVVDELESTVMRSVV